jgi:hypothetical protein
MAIPAIGPASFLFVYVWLLNWSFQYGWSNSWDQAADRDLAGAGVLSLPLVINSWFVLMWPRSGGTGRSSFVDRTEAPDFWARLTMTAVIGVVGLGSLGVLQWLYRRHAVGEGEHAKIGGFVVLTLMALTHVVFEVRRGRAQRARVEQEPDRPMRLPRRAEEEA